MMMMIPKCEKCSKETLPADVMTVAMNIKDSVLMVDGEYILYGYDCEECGHLTTAYKISDAASPNPPDEQEKLMLDPHYMKMSGENHDEIS